jgi:hypothetical protein
LEGNLTPRIAGRFVFGLRVGKGKVEHRRLQTIRINPGV